MCFRFLILFLLGGFAHWAKHCENYLRCRPSHICVLNISSVFRCRVYSRRCGWGPSLATSTFTRRWRSGSGASTPFGSKTQSSPLCKFFPGLRICIHLILIQSSILGWIPIRIRIPSGSRVLMTKMKKITTEKNLILSKSTIDLSLGLHKKRPSYKRSLQLSKENIQHFKT